MNYMFGDDEDYQDDNESGGRRKKLFSKIRRRMSIVKSNRKDDDEEEDEESTRNDDDEQHGFLKRKMQKRQEQKDLRKQHQKERQEKPTGAKSKEKPVHKELRRMSLHRGMPRLGASRALRMSISRPPPREDEEDDVAMPLPGHAHEDAPDLAELLTPPGDDKDADGKKRRSFLKGLSKKSSNGAASQSNSSTGGKRGKFSGSSTSSRKSKRRGKTKLASSDRSVDSPPSVASTESSIDNGGGGKGGAAQHHAPRREQSTKRRSGLGPFGKPKNGDDDDAGGDADCASLNNQAIPWIIKTWIYFVTVVVPFTILYYCFAGICHSSALQETPILKKVYFANMLFNGLGCTYRTGFWARQALDAKGVYAESPNVQRSGEMISSPPPAAAAAAPLSPRMSTISRKLPIRNRSGNQGRLGAFMGSTPVPRNASTSLPRSTRRSVGASFSPVRQMSSRLSPGQSSDTIRPHMRGSTMGIQRSQLSNVRSTATDNGGLVKKSARNEQARSRSAMEGKSSSHIIKSVWDVEHLIPISKKSSAPKARPSMDKHMSILEIYDVHATDERVGLLQ
jgi:hypothetical protein